METSHQLRCVGPGVVVGIVDIIIGDVGGVVVVGQEALVGPLVERGVLPALRCW